MNSTTSFSAATRRRAPQGFVLVVVLVILSLMAIIAVGYLSSMASERATASAFSNKTRAEQAAQAGVDSAMGILRDYFKAFPDSATAWDTAQATGKDSSNNMVTTEGTTLYFRAVPQGNNADTPDPSAGISDPNFSHADFQGGNGPNNSAGTGTSIDARKTFVLPLVSKASTKQVANKASALPVLAADTSVNLNTRRSVSDTQGWLGSPPKSIYANAGSPKPVTVPWVEITQKDPAFNGTIPPVVGRYAFWVEDESFRANISYADQGQTPGRDRRDNLTNRAPDPTDQDLTGLFSFFNIPNNSAGSQTAAAQSIVTARNNYPGSLFPEALAFAHSDGLSVSPADELAYGKPVDKLRYLTTSQSAALNLSRHGTQRLNINEVVSPTPAITPSDREAIQKQIDKLVQTIAFHAPNFGQRFYRTTWSRSPASNPPAVAAADLNNAQMVLSPYALIYLNKIAANLRDYADPDSIPTIIMEGADSKGNPKGLVRVSSRPTQAMNFNDGPNPVWAVGKDAAPFIQEAGAHFYGTYTPPSPTYTVNVDYFVEVWNMSTRQLTGADLGPKAYIRISNPPKWCADYRDPKTDKVTMANTRLETGGDGHTLGDTRDVPVPGRDYDFEIPATAVFPPGATTVLTTMPDTDPNYKTVVNSISGAAAGAEQTEVAKHFVYCTPLSGAKRTYTGTMPTGCNEVQMQYKNTVSSDYETAITIGNERGYIDSLEGALSMSGGFICVPEYKSPKQVYGAYLRGNLAASSGTGLQPSAIGDPRTNNEQLTYTLHIPSGGLGVDETQYKNYGNGIEATFGLPNYTSIDPAKAVNPWPDYYWFPHSVSGGPAGNSSASAAFMKAQHAPMIIANQPLISIGQLGDVFDPARLPYTSGADITRVRGGGRTFRIGQHDDRYDGVSFSNSGTWASWRLTDMFTTTNAIEQPGLININGVARDKGAALLAALQGFKFQPRTADGGTVAAEIPLHGDYQLDGKLIDQTAVQRLVTDIITNRLTPSDAQHTDPTTIHPFFERGELSETSILNFTPSGPGSGSLVTGVDMKTVIDRAQEELVRRLIDMTTTRGNVFTVYALGQSINQSGQGSSVVKRVTGTHQLRVTFKLTPKNSDGSLFQPATDANGKPADFNPTTDTGQANNIYVRFAKPDHYDISVLTSSSGNS